MNSDDSDDRLSHAQTRAVLQQVLVSDAALREWLTAIFCVPIAAVRASTYSTVPHRDQEIKRLGKFGYGLPRPYFPEDERRRPVIMAGSIYLLCDNNHSGKFYLGQYYLSDVIARFLRMRKYTSISKQVHNEYMKNLKQHFVSRKPNVSWLKKADIDHILEDESLKWINGVLTRVNSENPPPTRAGPKHLYHRSPSHKDRLLLRAVRELGLA